MLCSEYLGERLECGGQRADEDHCVCVRAVSVGRAFDVHLWRSEDSFQDLILSGEI